MRAPTLGHAGLISIMFLLALLACNGQPPSGTTLPVYDVTAGSVVTPQAAEALAEALGIPAENILEEDGSVRYLDGDTFLAVPMQPLITAFQTDGNEDGPPTLLEAFDFDAINNLQPIPSQRALSLAADALAAAELTPSGLGMTTLAAQAGVSYAFFEAVSARNGEVVAKAELDGQVSYALQLEGRRLVGPGAVVQLTFNGDETPTQVAYALRGLRKGRSVPIVPQAQAEAHAQALYLAANPTLGPQQVDYQYQCEEVVYYAPPLALDTVTRVFPHYDCAGTASVGPQQAEPVQLLQYFVPAVADIPKIALTAEIIEADQTLVLSYGVSVTGGTPPYTVTVSSGTTDTTEVITVTQPAAGSYPVYPYSLKTEEPLEAERVMVSVTDANGLLGVPVFRDVPFPEGPLPQALPLAPLVGGVRDVGITRGVCDLGAGIQQGFRSRMAADGVTIRFNWSCLSSWEKDFREPPGLDPSYVDNVDMTLYIGHGWPGGFTFDNATKDKGSLVHDEPAGSVRWGNQDLEWLALVSCQVLRYDAPTSGGLWFQRWGQEFDGLHLLLGFHTNAYDWSGFGGRFADWMLGRRIGFVALPPIPVRAAWFQATKEQQPSGVVAAVMGVYGPGGVTNFNDYFHGKGPVGPDLRGVNILGWWYVQGP